jgi:ATP-dependent RNA helicase DeaD
VLFNELKLNEQLLAGIKSVGYDNLTPIQESIIEKILNHEDVFAQAPTGTGKTAAFAIPLLNNVITTNTHAFVLCPTRELVNQIANEFVKLGKYIKDLRVVEILGSVPYGKQISELKRNPQIIVATPGRFLDHIKKNNVNLSHINTVVLDEVDEMFNMGFKRDVSTIISSVKHPHQTVLLSATISNDAQQASKNFQHNPFFFKNAGDEKKTNISIEQFYVLVNQTKKIDAIEQIIKKNHYKLTIIFTNTKHTAK